MATVSPIKDLDLTGKVAVVTGCNGGIGQSSVRHLQALGAKVHGTDLDQQSSLSGSVLESYRPADLAGQASLDACCDWIAELKPDVLVNNAALFDLGSVLDAGLDQYDRLFAINVRGFYAIMQAAARSMVATGKQGSIINFSSQWKQVDALFAKAEGLEVGEKKRLVGEAVPLGRMGDPIDVARVVCFLASDLSAYMTAQTIGVDGGNVLR